MFETIGELDRIEVEYCYCQLKRPLDLVKFLSLWLYVMLTEMIEWTIKYMV